MFQNPSNGYQVHIKYPWLWCLLFGCFYLAYHGAWAHALLAGVLAVFTGGISWLFYPFFARGIVRNSYLRKGWQEFLD